MRVFPQAAQVKRAPKALAALSAYAIQRSRALNFKLSVTKSEVIVCLRRRCAVQLVACRPTRLQVRTELYTAANVGALNRIRVQLQSVRSQCLSLASP